MAQNDLQMSSNTASTASEPVPFAHAVTGQDASVQNEVVYINTDTATDVGNVAVVNTEVASQNTLPVQSHEVVVETAHSNVAPEMLTAIPMGHGLALAGILFAIGLVGVMVRRNFLFMLMSLEIMMNAAALAFVVAGSRWVSPDGQVMFIFILTLAAAEASIGLAILLQFYHQRGHLDVDSANEMKG